VRQGTDSLIIFRYIARELLISTLAVTAVLVPIIVSGRLIKFLSQAAPGELSPLFVLEFVAYRLPGMLMLILPLALFLGVLLSYGRLYLESEMAVLKASGMSPHKLTVFALGPAVLIAATIAFLSLYLSPLAWQKLQQSYAEQEALSELDTLSPGRFEAMGGSRTVYTSGFSENRSSMEQVFYSERDPKTGQLRVVFAQSGEQLKDEQTGKRFLVLQDGHRYSGFPGQADYQSLAFDEYGFLLPERSVEVTSADSEALDTQMLLQSNEPQHLAELHWRLSLPILALVVVAIAVPLSKTNPRQGRYSKLIPSVILYLLYLTLLTTARDQVEKGAPVVNIWLVHLGFIGVAATLIFAESFWEKVFQRLPSLPKIRIGGRR